MLLALVGVTGIGKTFFTDEICKKLNFEKVNTIRTRKARPGENPKYFMSEEELEKMNEAGEIAYIFSVFGGKYGYLKEDIFNDKNMIFEMHYTMIDDWKRIRPDIKTIYILPVDLEMAKQKTLDRKLPKEVEEERLKEIDEHYNAINTNKELHDKFDCFIYNNYDEESKNNILELVEKILKEENKN